MQQNDSLAGGARNELQRLAHNLIGGRLEKLAETAKNHLELVEQPFAGYWGHLVGG